MAGCLHSCLHDLQEIFSGKLLGHRLTGPDWTWLDIAGLGCPCLAIIYTWLAGHAWNWSYWIWLGIVGSGWQWLLIVGYSYMWIMMGRCVKPGHGRTCWSCYGWMWLDEPEWTRLHLAGCMDLVGNWLAVHDWIFMPLTWLGLDVVGEMWLEWHAIHSGHGWRWLDSARPGWPIETGNEWACQAYSFPVSKMLLEFDGPVCMTCKKYFLANLAWP